MYDLEKILLELKSLPEYKDQISLQTVEGCNNYFYGTGNYTKLTHNENEFIKFNFDLPYINSILEKEKMYRARVMKLKSKTCLTLHQDPTLRKHIPLITNEKCFLVVDNEIIRLPADGNVYTVDTTKMHCAVNASWEDRIHIVGCI